jgi:hypothetical protein
MNWPANPVDVMMMALRSRPDPHCICAAAIELADRDSEFGNRVVDRPAYWNLVKAGIPGDMLVELCVLVHALAKARESLLIEFKRNGGVMQRGRPDDFGPLFRMVCFMLASRYGRGRQFREDFRDLAHLVFDKKISVDSYRTELKRARHELFERLSQPR